MGERKTRRARPASEMFRLASRPRRRITLEQA